MEDQLPKKKRKRPLKPEHQRFVALVAQGSTPTAAYRQVYPKANESSIDSAPSMLMAKPHIQEGIRAVMERTWPELQTDVKNVLQKIILSPTERTPDRLAAIKMVGEYFGWKAPQQSQHLHAKVNLTKYDLPGSRGDNGDAG